MVTHYHCRNNQRRELIRTSKGANGQPLLNGIDYLEVSPDQKTLKLHFIHNLSTPSLTEENWVILRNDQAADISITSTSSFANILTLRINHPGDKVGNYKLRLISLQNESPPPEGFDPQLSTVEFSFRADELSEFDCLTTATDTGLQAQIPPIDYLAKDYASFRQLMLDRLNITMPNWRERNPADVGVMLVELLAYAGDRLSYYQDAVATEAYLGKARQRTSIRRHARLLDYPMHDGCNARVWVRLEVSQAGDGQKLLGASKKDLRPGAKLFTKREDKLPKQPTGEEYAGLLNKGVQIFETMHDITLYKSHNQIYFYTWDAEIFYLEAGAIHATLNNENNDLNLQVGDVLIFTQVLGFDSGEPAEADLTQRHVVRLTKVKPYQDPLYQKDLLEISWAAGDALPFHLWITNVVNDTVIKNISVAQGNVVLADHGCTITAELPLVPETGRYRPQLQFGPVTQQGYVQYRRQPFNPKATAKEALIWDMRHILPQIYLKELDPNSHWLPQRDLLNSDSFAREFVVETEDDGSAFLRFGDNESGKQPAPQTQFRVTYRIGNGSSGNVGSAAIQQIEPQFQTWITKVDNPIPAQGGTDPEAIAQVRLYAPQAFRTLKRAVTEDDYGAITKRFPTVREAVATRRWTGSWYTVFITVDREGGQPIDGKFKQKLTDFLEAYRLIGQDVKIDSPIFVGLDIGLKIQVAPDYFNSQVKEALQNTFSNRILPNRQLGFFHPDNLGFAQPVYLSQVITRAMEVAGVVSVTIQRFQRWGQSTADNIKAGKISLNRLEIARVDNDLRTPQNGKIEFEMEGGL
ncbi:putative baseplate assembly protein [Aetokthonos hydrillicola Thurmond2011]|jgi:hypothetical protein|uniref:Baseplate assembly protein n=1 Tax=Aetokthonos hydrillicola Thurmond2011 TaxID=2712845 RepID=A0AAP5M8H6_9CYAN|nr:putative baseplate assembly protein [Aetokthonos hydrillicola]MBO3457581.1 putative baseplate assembly protein [Aetokthonos hydrillicola CCALA 1050]MBW4590914.1 putative baseplate assembly protein [Aetokthonos hydrillicola CCALA 1050]MDR9894737.1 putative baseplate assembly protein [Aetokthonos hydrillicola Thurmond2011]